MLLSPTEHKLHKYNLGKIHMAPEEHGVDILMVAKGRKLGVQRKAVPDLLASVEDGRLTREIAMMKQLDQAILLIEGRMAFDGDGNLLGNDYGRRWTRGSIQGLLWSARQKGCWVQHTDGLADTVQTLVNLELWWKKGRHTTLEQRPGATSPWGTSPSDRDYAMYVLQSVPGVGVELAGRIYDLYGLPLAWTIGKDALMKVPGIGKVKATKMMKAFNVHEGEK